MADLCELVRPVLVEFSGCTNTLDGARIVTHCLYPSHELVYVYIVHEGDQYRVHDGGGAYRTAWSHGRDENTIVRAIERSVARFDLECTHETIISPRVNYNWLNNAVVAVANASAFAATQVVEKSRSAGDNDFSSSIEEKLVARFGRADVAKDYEITGRSGGKRRFDFAVKYRGEYGALVSTVSPFAASVNSRFVAFADAEADQLNKFAVYKENLDTSDVALLASVASLVPVSKITDAIARNLAVLN